jgi:hypothetical protein
MVEGALDFAAFERAWEEVLRRHAVLRTAFAWEDMDQKLQVVFREAGLRIEYEDWRGDEVASRLEGYLEANAAVAFNLAEAPLFRLGLRSSILFVHQPSPRHPGWLVESSSAEGSKSLL